MKRRPKEEGRRGEIRSEREDGSEGMVDEGGGEDEEEESRRPEQG